MIYKATIGSHVSNDTVSSDRFALTSLSAIKNIESSSPLERDVTTHLACFLSTRVLDVCVPLQIEFSVQNDQVLLLLIFVVREHHFVDQFFQVRVLFH